MHQESSLNKTNIYWLLQVAGWLAMLFIETINYTFFIIGQFRWDFFWGMAQFALYGLLITHFYKHWLIKPTTFEKSYTQIWFSAAKDTLLISLIKYILLFAPALFSTPEYFTKQQALIDFLGQVMNIARYVVVWIIIYYLYHILQRNRAIQEEKLMAENLAKTSELELLKTQLNPHFLFNALNSIKALVNIDTEKSREAIIKLSELLRFSLNYEKNTLISLEEEVSEVKKYLELEEIRFGNRLQFSIDLEPETLAKRVPPAMILTLAENAIKHGITQLPEGGKVHLQTRLLNNQLWIELSNSGQLKLENRKGIGLQNIKKRLHKLYGDAARFNLIQEEQTVRALLSFPYKLNQNENQSDIN